VMKFMKSAKLTLPQNTIIQWQNVRTYFHIGA
jgi:hypothetical protein